MNKVYRKGRAERTGRTVLLSGDNPFLAAHYHVAVGGSSNQNLLTDAVTSGAGAPTHTPTVANQIYTDKNTGAQYSWYNSGWH